MAKQFYDEGWNDRLNGEPFTTIGTTRDWRDGWRDCDDVAESERTRMGDPPAIEPRDDSIAMIGIPERVLRYAAAGILIEEGEVGREMAMAVASGRIALNSDGRVARAIRKVASVVLTLRSNGMLSLPHKPA